MIEQTSDLQVEALLSLAGRYSKCKYLARKKALSYLQDKVIDLLPASLERNQILTRLSNLLRVY